MDISSGRIMLKEAYDGSTNEQRNSSETHVQPYTCKQLPGQSRNDTDTKHTARDLAGAGFAMCGSSCLNQGGRPTHISYLCPNIIPTSHQLLTKGPSSGASLVTLALRHAAWSAQCAVVDRSCWCRSLQWHGVPLRCS